jgi:hypothetical protein
VDLAWAQYGGDAIRDLVLAYLDAGSVFVLSSASASEIKQKYNHGENFAATTALGTSITGLNPDEYFSEPSWERGHDIVHEWVHTQHPELMTPDPTQGECRTDAAAKSLDGVNWFVYPGC